MINYRIYTEDKHVEQIKELVGEFFSAYSIYHIDGVYKDTSEYSLVVEILSAKHDHSYMAPLINSVAESIKLLNAQDSVVLTWHEVGFQVV